MSLAPKDFGARRSVQLSALLVGGLALACAVRADVAGSGSSLSSRAAAPGIDEPAPPGVENPRRAWQNWTLNCQGCHRPDGSGSPNTAPPLAGTVSKFLTVPGGREYLCRVPGVAASPFTDAELAEVMNWMFWRFDREHIPAHFAPLTAEEIGRWRTQPLRLEATPMRLALLRAADAAEGAVATGSPGTAEPKRPKDPP